MPPDHVDVRKCCRWSKSPVRIEPCIMLGFADSSLWSTWGEKLAADHGDIVPQLSLASSRNSRRKAATTRRRASISRPGRLSLSRQRCRGFSATFSFARQGTSSRCFLDLGEKDVLGSRLVRDRNRHRLDDRHRGRAAQICLPTSNCWSTTAAMPFGFAASITERILVPNIPFATCALQERVERRHGLHQLDAVLGFRQIRCRP